MESTEIPEKKQMNPGLTVEIDDGEGCFFINTEEGSFRFPIQQLWQMTRTLSEVCKTLESEGKLTDSHGNAVKFNQTVKVD